MGFLIWCSSGTQLTLALLQDILRGEQPWRSAAQEQVCNPQQDGRQEEGCGVWASGRSTISMRTYQSQVAPASKTEDGGRGHLGATCRQGKG